MWSSGYCAVTSRPVRVTQHRLARGHLGEAADAVELGLEPPVRRRRTPPSHPRPASAGTGGATAISGRVLGAGEEREPVRPGLHEVELQAGVAPAVQPERDLRVGPLDRLVPAVVEDADLAGAVVALRDRALELPVLERVVLGPHRQALVALRGRQPLGTAQRRQRAVAAPAARRSAAASRDACGSRTSSPARRRRPARARACPAKSRLRTYSNRFGILRRGDDLLGRLARRRLRRRAAAAGCGRPPQRRSSAFVSVGRSSRRALPGEQVAHSREPVPDVVDPEVLRLEAACRDLVPRERRRDRRPRLGPHRVRGGDVRALPVHVVVDEDLAGAVGDLPRHRHAIGVGLQDQPSARADEARAPARACMRPRSIGTKICMTRGARRLRVPAQAELIEQAPMCRATVSTSSYVYGGNGSRSKKQ